MGSGNDPVFPINFLCTLAAGASPEAPELVPVVQCARAATPGPDTWSLLEVLLTGPYLEQAPEWMLRAALEALPTAPEQHGSDGGLARIALSHPSCSVEVRTRLLSSCTPIQLALLGTGDSESSLPSAVAEELRRRGPEAQPMTAELLDHPTPAQQVLERPGLHPVVVAAAVDLLPTGPKMDRAAVKQDFETANRVYERAWSAWQSMWVRVLCQHTAHHRLILDNTEDMQADYVVRELLLGELPWHVDPALLREVAAADLAQFPGQVLMARAGRERREGAEVDDILRRYAEQLNALPGRARQDTEYFLRHESGLFIDDCCRAPVGWAERAASGRWKHILDPERAKDGYRPAVWLSSREQLADLARRFAEVAAPATDFWEPDDDRYTGGLETLQWLRAVLLHLPELPVEAKGRLRTILAHTTAKLHRGAAHSLHTYVDIQRANDIAAELQRVLEEPLPLPSAARRSSLGDPDKVTVRHLRDASDHQLITYLDRHRGNDGLIETALLSMADRHHKLGFADVLARHTDPAAALHRLTQDLRRRLGGIPALRQGWVRNLLDLPHCTSDLVRAMPAWAALDAQGPTWRTAHPAVVATVRDALGNEAAAWRRFSGHPARETGPAAWIPLGDILDASKHGSAWPMPR